MAGVILLAGGISARGQETNQFYLAAQYNWGQVRGFFLVVEGTPHGQDPAQISDAKINLGVGDGHGWHFVSGGANFSAGTRYRVSARIGDGSAEIFLNDQSVGRAGCAFIPAAGPLLFDQGSNVMHGAATYEIREQALQVRSGKISRVLASAGSSLPAQLTLLNPATAGGQANIATGNSVTLQTTFEFAAKPSLKKLSPFIDKFGQCAEANWPGKVEKDSDLTAAQGLEAKRFAQWPAPAHRDQYGGAADAGWHDAGTGFFHVTRRGGKWWLITPAGNPCFYLGICNAPAYTWEATPITGREYLFAWLPAAGSPFAAALIKDAWHAPGEENTQFVCFHTANLIREFGGDWRDRATASALRRVRALAFNGFGKWSTGGLGVCDLPVLGNHGPDLVKHPDIFDSRVRAQTAEILRREITPHQNDPWLLGWSVGNEKDEDIGADEIRQILQMDKNVPARQALMRIAGRAPIDDAMIEKLREYYEQAYCSFLYKSVKAIDPNHLYFGNWVTPNWWENENDWRISAANCDVVGFDWYAEHFHGEPMGHLIAGTDKPVLCGEFSFPPSYAGARGYGTYGTHTTTEAEAGEKYTAWIHDAASDPHCVGAFYFQYRDQPLTGRGPGNSRDTIVVGEDFAFGLVDVTDRIKWDFARRVREANLGALGVRLGAEH